MRPRPAVPGKPINIRRFAKTFPGIARDPAWDGLWTDSHLRVVRIPCHNAKLSTNELIQVNTIFPVIYVTVSPT